MESRLINTVNNHLNAGLALAKGSPCLRRKYCAQIIGEDTLRMAYGVNERVSDCCDNECVREASNAPHGQMVERGGEIHAEQLALIRFEKSYSDPDDAFYLSGVETSTDKELLAPDVYPCHSCALMIKAAGFARVVLRGKDSWPIHMPIEEIISYRESEWFMMMSS